MIPKKESAEKRIAPQAQKKRPSVIAGLIFLTSYSALSRISRDPRNALRLSEDDKEERSPTQLGIYTQQSRDPRVKPEDDKEERRPIKREPRGRKGQV